MKRVNLTFVSRETWSYIGETGKSYFCYAKKRTNKDVKTETKSSRIAHHAWPNDNVVDFNNASIIDKRNYRIRKFLESWHTTYIIRLLKGFSANSYK